LLFDARNPRLVEAGAPASQKEILLVLWREFAVDEIALSIAANGYFQHEPLFATRDKGQLVVIEGNRRLAAVKLLLDDTLRKEVGATDLPKVDQEAKQRLHKLPVIICDRDEIWQYVGFKHVNGPQQWQSYSKAEYIAWVHNTLGVPLDKIAEKIGDQHSTVKRFYRALMVFEQAEQIGVFEKKDRTKKHFSFSHLYTGLDYPGIQQFIGLSREKSYKQNPVPKNKANNLGDLLVWLYGSESRQKQPVVISQNPDLRILDEVLLTRNGTAALRRGMPLRVARDIGKGDEKLFRESLVSAKAALQEARGKLLSGYNGEPDLIVTAQEIKQLAESVHEEMNRVKARRPSKRN
jgi:hypothetical protein